METVKKLADKMGVVPRLKLGTKIAGGGVESNGPHHVKFLAEPTLVKGKDFKGNEQEQMKFLVEESGVKFAWFVPIKGKEGQPSYLIQHLVDVEVNDERILEMKRHGAQNHIEVRQVDSDEMDDIADSIPGPNDEEA
jgi:hypothetical protein